MKKIRKTFLNGEGEKRLRKRKRLAAHDNDSKKIFAKMMGITVKELNKVLTIWSQK